MSGPEFVLIEGGELYTPEWRGAASVLAAGGTILKIGDVDRRLVESVGVPVEVLDARGCVVAPGFIDPHEHLVGGSGEDGFASRTPEVFCVELITNGITAVVGCLGTDTTMKTLPDLLGKVRAFEEEGLSAYMYTGGYAVPPTTMLSGVREDVMFIDKVIGLGEVAIADQRSLEPAPRDLAKCIIESHVGGMLSHKAGVTHVHVGTGSARLRVLREVLDQFEVNPRSIYPTHMERSRELLCEGIELTRRGSFIDIDTVEEDLVKWLGVYSELGGDLAQLTVSTDASSNSPGMLLNQFRECVRAGWPLEVVLPLVTRNTAAALKLHRKGVLDEGNDADMVVLNRRSLELRHVIARGAVLMKEGMLRMTPHFLESSNRRIELYGKKDVRAEPVNR